MKNKPFIKTTLNQKSGTMEKKTKQGGANKQKYDGMMVIIILLPPKNSFEYGDKFWGKKKKGGEEGWERNKRKRIKEGKYENNQYI